MIAALFVASDGPYIGLEGIDPWTQSRDARLYAGPFPVIAHPPCERWGRYWGGGPSAKVKRVLGDDGGCFASALASVRKWGGVLEHPAASHAWAHHDLPRPVRGAWVYDGIGYGTEVDQGAYGHPARKATWLYYVGVVPPPKLNWEWATGVRCDEGFHSKEERRAARAAGKAPVPRLSKRQLVHTPLEFRELLVTLATAACTWQERAVHHKFRALAAWTVA